MRKRTSATSAARSLVSDFPFALLEPRRGDSDVRGRLPGEGAVGGRGDVNTAGSRGVCGHRPTEPWSVHRVFVGSKLM